MLTKNIYILYPPGYSGSYVNWAISISDSDMAESTTKNPLNSSSSKEYGSAGTSHLHHRVPTHQGIDDHVTWMVLNKPTDKKIFIINSDNNNIGRTLSHIVYSDPDPVVIIIHDGGNDDIRTYGSINGITKWPIRTLLGMRSSDLLLEMGGVVEQTVWDQWDPFDCATSLACRNTIATGRLNSSIEVLSPIGNDSINAMYDFHKRKSWYEIRSQAHPHEVNLENYLNLDSFPWDKVHQFSCLDVATKEFPNLLETILTQSNAVSNMTLDYFKQYHPSYIDAQNNLQWFDSIYQWRNHNIVDAYLTSHAVIQGFFIQELAKKYTLPIDWDVMTITDIADSLG